MLLVLFAPFALRADEIIVGTGTESANMVPFGNCYNYSWMETLYPSSEIGQAGTITALSFNCVNPSADYNYTADIKVYMAEVSKTELTQGTFTPEADLELVYEGTNVAIGDEAWETFTLSNPFEYSGENNLAVIVSKSSNGTSMNMKWAYTTVPYSLLLEFSDANPEGALYPNGLSQFGGDGYALNRRANIKLIMGEGTTPEQPEDPEVPETPEENTIVFSYDFNDGTMTGWNAIDQDGDSYNWYISNIAGVGGSACIASDTYIGSALYPDNIIVTTSAYELPANSVLTWKARPTDAAYCNEHYAVVVSTDNETFTNVWEETLIATTNFTEKTLDLSSYAGQTVYVGFRHFNCNGSNATALIIDDVVLAGASDSEQPEQPEQPEDPETPATNELVVGNGTYGTSVAPFRNTYYNSWVETIYPLSEIGDQAFTINSIAYNCASVGVSDYTLTNVYIYIGETTRTQIGSSDDWTPESELTLVYSGSNVVISDEEWETFVLDTPYDFSGNKNLVIAVGKTSAQFNSAVKWYAVPTDENSIMYVNSDNDASFANYPTNNGSMGYYRPNVKLGYSNATEPEEPEQPEQPEDPETPVVAEGDTWENAIEVTSFPFTSTPDYANLNNDYSLPGLGTDGADAVYKLSLTEETKINATVTGANAKIALYAEHFNGEDGPGSTNYYDPEYVPATESTFFFDFNDGTMDGWYSIDQDGDTYGWGVSDGTVGQYAGIDMTPCLHSDSYIGASLYPDNIVATTEKYEITEESVLTWYVKPQDPAANYCADHYGIVGSTDGVNFVTIWEETMTPIYDFEQRTLDLDYFAGQTIHLGFYHYMCNGSNATGILIDNVELTCGTTEEPEQPEDPETPEGLTTFMFNFDDADLSAFTTIDADGDSYNWNCYEYGIGGTTSLASESYIIGVGVLSPDNYIYTNEKYAITAESKLSYDVTWQYGEYYSVVVSTDGTTFTNVYEEQLTGTGSGYSDSKEIDLSAYAGQQIHIGLRHYNCSDGLRLMFDNFTLTDGNTEEPEQPEDPETPENPEGSTTFAEDFNDGEMDGWRLFQNDGDAYNWGLKNAYGITGPDGSYCLHSNSYAASVLWPDNYAVTTSTYAITANSTLTFVSRPESAGFFHDNYGVVVSEDNENWTVVWSERYDAWNANFVEHVVDLSAYAGKNIYFGFRHYDCNGNDSQGVLIDNVVLGEGSAKRSNSKTIEMTVPAGTYYLAASATEAFTVNINIAGNNDDDDEQGLPTVAQVTAVENGANVDVAWNWENRLAIADAKSGMTKRLGVRNETSYNFHSYKLYRTNGESTEVLADNLTELTYQDATWSEATPGTYKWGVAAMYTAEENRSRETVEILNEGFETGYYVLPEGWTNYSEPATANEWGNIQVQGSIYSYTACTGSYSAFQLGGYADNGSLYYLVTPAIDFSSTLNPTISFNYISPAWVGAYNNTYVMYSESPTGPWTTVWEGAAADTWAEGSASLSECSGKTVYVAFCVLENKAWGAGFDNVVISGETTDGPIPVASEIVWSNSIDKDMITTVSVAVTADDNASVAGTTVSLVNVNEPTYVYETTLDATGTYEWTDFRKGTYELTIALDGYYSCATAEVMEIMEATEIECTLEKMPEMVDGLYVSATGWAMWDYEAESFDITLNGTTIAQNVEKSYYQVDVTSLTEGQEYTLNVIPAVTEDVTLEYTWKYRSCDNYTGVTNLTATVEEKTAVITWTLPVYEETEPVYEFSSNFDNGSLYGWTAIDADGDGHNWKNTAEFANDPLGHNNTHCAASFSYDNNAGILVPNNFLVSETKVDILADSKLTYYVSANDRTYCEEHYAVAVSTTGTNPSDFVNIYEETLSAGEPAYEGSTQGEWFNREIDLSAYAGQKIYIAFRHYQCLNQWFMKVDDVNLTAESAKSREEGEWIFYDNGVNESAFGFFDYGTGEAQQINWAIMFPGDLITAYHGKQITKVSIYVYEAHDGGFSIHQGGVDGPGTMVHSQTYSATASGTYQEFELTTPVTIDAKENLWIQFSNSNGGYVAAHSTDCGDPNGRWISDDEGATWYDSSWYGEGWYGTWQMRAYVEGEGGDTPVDPVDPEVVDAEVLGVMLYRDGELLTEEVLNAESYTDTELTTGDHEYEVRVVYGNENNPATYYAMSCPQAVTATVAQECAAPEKLFGQCTYQDGVLGTELIWPYNAASEWLYYDNGVNQDGIGGPAEFYWGVMFPAASISAYDGLFLTKVSLFDFAQSEGDINIYYGGTSAPGTLVHTQPYVGNGTGNFFEFELTSALPIDVTENLWVVFSTKNGTNYPASCCADCGDPNSRWISMDGVVWEDIADYNLYNTWMIRAMVANAKGEVSTLEPLQYEYTTGEGQFAAAGVSRGETFEHYNIYRGTSANNFELVGESTVGSYFDQVEEGTYYYQVTAVYTNNGEECESEPATAYNDATQNYVVVEVTAIDENGVNGMIVYPNPTKGNLNITAEAMTQITITNALGQVMYENDVTSNNEVINMAEYEAGVYMVRITTENGVAVKRITVVK